MSQFQFVLSLLDYAAVFVFAATGALAAARRGHDIITFGFFAAVTGVGGGTLRDLLMGVPVFWVRHAEPLVMCLGAAVAIWIFGMGRFRERVLTWLDALGLSAYAVIGAAKALDLGLSPLVAIVMGVLTATFGGIIRDTLDQQPSALQKREIYVTAAVAGAAVFVLLTLVRLPVLPAGLIGFAVALTLRAAAIVFALTLPSFGRRAEG
ncbi:MAG: trimeric intracellular cation channel family protein [Pseudomonadota bacterium]